MPRTNILIPSPTRLSAPEACKERDPVDAHSVFANTKMTPAGARFLIPARWDNRTLSRLGRRLGCSSLHSLQPSSGPSESLVQCPGPDITQAWSTLSALLPEGGVRYCPSHVLPSHLTEQPPFQPISHLPERLVWICLFIVII